MKRHSIAWGLGLVLAMAIGTSSAEAKSPAYHLRGRVEIGGDGGWDLLAFDPRTARLYIARSSRVQVVDVDRRALVGEIAGTRGVHGIALAPELGRGFASDGQDSTVTVFDPKSLGVLSTIKVPGRSPDAIVYEPVTRRVFVFNAGSGNVSVLDAVTDSLLGTVDLGGQPELADVDGRGGVFVNLEDSSVVVKLDAATLAIRSRWPLSPGEEPTGMAMDRAHERLFVGCHNKLMVVMDATTGRVITTLPIGGGVDGTAFDPKLGLAFSANGEGSLTVVEEESPDRFRHVADVPTQRGARTLALDEKGHRVFVVTAKFGETPAATAEHPRPRPPMVPGTFAVLIYGP